MVDHEQQSTGIEPDGLQHHAGVRFESQLGVSRFLREGCGGCIYAAQAIFGANSPDRRNLQRAVLREVQPQSGVMIDQGLQRCDEALVIERRRNFQKHRLAEGPERHPALQQPLNDGRWVDRADSVVAGDGRLRRHTCGSCEYFDRTVLEDIARREE